jgi:hypothetical protein
MLVLVDIAFVGVVAPLGAVQKGSSADLLLPAAFQEDEQ